MLSLSICPVHWEKSLWNLVAKSSTSAKAIVCGYFFFFLFGHCLAWCPIFWHAKHFTVLRSFFCPSCYLAPPFLGPFLFFFFPFVVKATSSSSSLLVEALHCKRPLRVSSWTKSSQALSHEGKFSLATKPYTNTAQGAVTPFKAVHTNSGNHSFDHLDTLQFLSQNHLPILIGTLKQSGQSTPHLMCMILR